MCPLITNHLHFECTQCWDHLALLVEHVDSIQNMLPEVSQKCLVITFWTLLYFSMCLTCVQNVPDLFIWIHWGHMTGYILKALNVYPTTTLNSHLWVYFKCAQFFTTGHIVITLVLIIQMQPICNWWAHFGHSGRKHLECAQFLTIRHIVDPLQRTFKMCPIFNHWVHCGQMLSVPTMYSPCAHWVYGSLSPVTAVKMGWVLPEGWGSAWH